MIVKDFKIFQNAPAPRQNQLSNTQSPTVNGESLKIHSQSCRHNYCRFWAMLPLDSGCFAWPGLQPLGGFPSWVGLVCNLPLARHPFIGRLCPNLRHLILTRPTSTALQITDADVLACQTWQTCAPLLVSGQISITNVGNPTMAIFFAVPVAMGNRNN